MASKKQGGAFGRDEMNLLLGVAGGDESKAGIGTAGTALLQSRGFSETNNKSNKGSKGNKKEAVDFSTLSTAETAALIQKEQLSKGVAAHTSRHRAQRSNNKKRLAHHELLEQELMAQQQHQQQQHKQPSKQDSDSEEDDDENDFAAASKKKKTNGANKRIQLEPQIVAQQDAAPRRQRQRRRRSSSSSSDDSSRDDHSRKRRRQRRTRRKDSSSDESSSASNNQQRRRRRSPSSSSSDDEEDARRQRRLKKRQELDSQHKNETINQDKQIKDKMDIDDTNRENEEPTKATPKTVEKTSKEGGFAKTTEAQNRPKKKQKDSSSSSSSDGSSSDSSADSSSSSSSSSEDEPAPVMAKPLFVPKRKRLQLEQERLEAEREEKEQEEKAKKQKQKRKLESRALVAQVVSTGTTAASTDDGMVSEDEEALAKRMLNDKDDDEANERDLWEVRELGRLLEEIDRLRKKEQEEAEYRRRQLLTDEQAQAEDRASGRYQQPGSNRMQSGTGDKDKPKYMQKYFHRGAYYMDEDEFEEGDVRLRAKEYEQGVTESAKSRGDIAALPKVMQRKQFGRANQSKYQGLAQEDTSNRESSTVLPLVHHSKQRKATDVHRNRNKK